MADNPFEIPQALRQVSEQNVKQARAAYEQLMEFMTNAMGPWMAAAPSNPMTAGLQHMQDSARKIAMENAEAAFTFGGKMSNAQTAQEILALQTQFAQDRMQAFVTQTQQLCGAIAEAFQKSEPGPVGVSMGAMSTNLIPSNLTTGFKDIQDRAVSMAKKNAEVSISLGRKDQRGAEFPRCFRTSVPFCSGTNEGLRRSDAGDSKADRGNPPETPTWLICRRPRTSAKVAKEIFIKKADVLACGVGH